MACLGTGDYRASLQKTLLMQCVWEQDGGKEKNRGEGGRWIKRGRDRVRWCGERERERREGEADSTLAKITFVNDLTVIILQTELAELIQRDRK